MFAIPLMIPLLLIFITIKRKRGVYFKLLTRWSVYPWDTADLIDAIVVIFIIHTNVYIYSRRTRLTSYPRDEADIFLVIHVRINSRSKNTREWQCVLKIFHNQNIYFRLIFSISLISQWNWELFLLKSSGWTPSGHRLAR